MSTEILRFLYDFDHLALGRNCDGLTHEQSVNAPPAGNSLNWVLGHIVLHRNLILELVDEPPVWPEGVGEPYARGSTPLDPACALPWDRLRADFEASQERLRAGIARLTSALLAEKRQPEDARTLGERIHFLQFHEAYHIGQLGLLRRMAGLGGAI